MAELRKGWVRGKVHWCGTVCENARQCVRKDWKDFHLVNDVPTIRGRAGTKGLTAIDITRNLSNSLLHRGGRSADKLVAHLADGEAPNWKRLDVLLIQSSNHDDAAMAVGCRGGRGCPRECLPKPGAGLHHVTGCRHRHRRCPATRIADRHPRSGENLHNTAHDGALLWWPRGVETDARRCGKCSCARQEISGKDPQSACACP